MNKEVLVAHSDKLNLFDAIVFSIFLAKKRNSPVTEKNGSIIPERFSTLMQRDKSIIGLTCVIAAITLLLVPLNPATQSEAELATAAILSLCFLGGIVAASALYIISLFAKVDIAYSTDHTVQIIMNVGLLGVGSGVVMQENIPLYGGIFLMGSVVPILIDRWFVQLSKESNKTITTLAALVLCLAALLYLPVAYFLSVAIRALFAAGLLAIAFSLWTSSRETRSMLEKDPSHQPQIADSETGLRITWKVLFAAMLAAFIVSPQLSAIVAHSDIRLTSTWFIGLAVAPWIVSLVLFGAARFMENHDLFELINILVPVSIAVLAVLPWLDFLSGPAGGMVWNVLRETFILLPMVIATIVLVQLYLYENGGRATLAVYGLFLPLAYAVGLLYSQAYGAVPKIPTLLLFVAYLLTTIFSLTRERTLTHERAAIEARSTAQAQAVPDTQAALDSLAYTYQLSAREQEVLALLGQGHTQLYIADALSISASTVNAHARNIYRKCNVSSREELLALIAHVKSELE